MENLLKQLDIYSNYLYFTCFIVVIITIIFVSYTLKIGEMNCNRIAKYTIATSNQSTVLDRSLNQCFIKTAYNCCCTGNFTNDYVDLCALINCSKQGVRALDFQIFSLNNKPVISANIDNNPYFKELYNYLDFYQTMLEINKLFILSQINQEPLFLIFRICSNQLTIYDQMYHTLVEIFGEKSYNPIIYENENFNYDQYDRSGNNELFMNDIINNMNNKVCIIVEYLNEDGYTNSLYQIASYAISTTDSLYKKESDSINKNDIDISHNFINNNFINKSTSTNYDFVSFGIFNKCNFIGLNFQIEDSYLKLYNQIFTSPLLYIEDVFNYLTSYEDSNTYTNNIIDRGSYQTEYDKWDNYS